MKHYCTILIWLAASTTMAAGYPTPLGRWKLQDKLATTDVLDTQAAANLVIQGGSTSLALSSTGPGGIITNAFDFAATGDYANYTDNVVNGGNKLTIAAWIKLAGVVASSQVICSEYQTTGNQRSFFLSAESDGKLKFVLSTDGTAVVDTFSVTSYATGTWQHIAVTYDGSTQAVLFYFDTVSESPSGGSGTPPTTLNNSDATAPFRIGAGSAAGLLWTEELADIGVWKAVLTQPQIRDFMADGQDGKVLAQPSGGEYPSLTGGMRE